MNDNNEGYIYIFKCIVGASSNICKIGVTKNYNGRLEQHGRTLYYGFVPYTDFLTGKPIATVFKVKNSKESDLLIQKDFEKYRLAKLEIYSIDYDEAIKKIYECLNNSNLFIELYGDGYTDYNYIATNNEQMVLQENYNTRKEAFESLRNRLEEKFEVFPIELQNMLREKEDFKENVPSHFKTGNYIDFRNNLVLDINTNKSKRSELLSRLEEILYSDPQNTPEHS